MVVSSLKRGLAAASLAFAGFVTVAASPAIANTSAATADVTAPIVDAQNNAITGGDQQFSELFARWEALDGADDIAPAPMPSISIPSRMPVDNARLSSSYGMRTHPVLGGRRNHSGIDLAAPTGTPIYATADGIVSRADRSRTYGLVTYIEHGAQVQTRYAHMSRMVVADGQAVKKGDVIGYVGSTGRSTGPHLHYEVRISGRAVNPMPYMAETDAQRAFALVTGEGGRGGR